MTLFLVASYVDSLPKMTSFLETDEGRIYLPLFQSLRLHGITDSEYRERLLYIVAFYVKVFFNLVYTVRFLVLFFFFFLSPKT